MIAQNLNKRAEENLSLSKKKLISEAFKDIKGEEELTFIYKGVLLYINNYVKGDFNLVDYLEKTYSERLETI